MAVEEQEKETTTEVAESEEGKAPEGPRFDKDTARQRTDEVKTAATKLWMMVLDLYEGGAHIALDYGSWKDYWEAEFGGSGARGEQLLRAGRVARVLLAADLPLPSNDLIARELIPVLRQAPDKVGEVWARAMETTGGKPTGRDVRELVAPYRQTTKSGRADRRSAPDEGGRRFTRRSRNIVAMPLRDSHASLEAAQAGLDDALKTDPSLDSMKEWLDHAEQAGRALAAIIRTLKGRVDKAQSAKPKA